MGGLVVDQDVDCNVFDFLLIHTVIISRLAAPLLAALY
jgi:hypothetical protein